MTQGVGQGDHLALYVGQHGQLVGLGVRPERQVGEVVQRRQAGAAQVQRSCADQQRAQRRHGGCAQRGGQPAGIEGARQPPGEVQADAATRASQHPTQAAERGAGVGVRELGAAGDLQLHGRQAVQVGE
jgi:hypothetical protein